MINKGGGEKGVEGRRGRLEEVERRKDERGGKRVKERHKGGSGEEE